MGCMLQCLQTVRVLIGGEKLASCTHQKWEQDISLLRTTLVYSKGSA